MNEEIDQELETSPQTNKGVSPVKIIVTLWISFFLVIFYESESLLHYTNAKKSNSKGEVIKKLSFEDIYIEPLNILSQAFEDFKTATGIRGYWSEEKKLVQTLSESPLILTKTRLSSAPKASPGSEIKPLPHKPVEKKDIKPSPPYKVLLIGDSNIREAVGIALEKRFMKYKDLVVIREGVYSTGLSRPDYFDWAKKLKQFILKYQPNVVVVMMGTNDAQAMYSSDKKKFIPLRSKTWDEEYKKNTIKLLKVLEKEKIFTYWIGLPVMEKAYFRRRMARVNRIQEESAKEFQNVRYIKTWNLFMQNKQIQRFLKYGRRYYRVRLSDGIHLSILGGRHFSQYVLAKISGELGLTLKANKVKKIKTKRKLGGMQK
ncbi:MAG: DUF459 domain-containing protein [Spirochaetota bacterium]|nr:DUF459 domain-containing protein [Spirochaetota bacterium]